MRLRPATLVRGWAATILALFALGCGQAPNAEDANVTRSSIIGGENSPSEQDATVLVLEQSVSCTGVVVAPTLVLTARNCLFDVAGFDNRKFYTSCLPNGSGAPVLRARDARGFTIYVGLKSPRQLGGKAVRFYTGEDLDLCANDIALIEVDTPLSPAPLAMRLDSDARKGEKGTLVGWGLGADEKILSPPQFRQQRAVQVLAVGDTTLTTSEGRSLKVYPGSFVTDEAGCFSDQGGPFIDEESNAVVGILSTFEPADPSLTLDAGLDFCRGANNVFRSLAPQSSWIRDAFAQANQVPWLEGQPPLGAPGESCQSSGECSSGICKSASGGAQFCSQDCNSKACPRGLDCVGNAGERWCVPAQVPSRDAASAGCSLALGERDGGLWLAFALLAMACCHRRAKCRSHLRVRNHSREIDP